MPKREILVDPPPHEVRDCDFNTSVYIPRLKMPKGAKIEGAKYFAQWDLDLEKVRQRKGQVRSFGDYGSETNARQDMKTGARLYRIDITRLE